MAFYKWMQLKGGEEQWSLLLADQEEALVKAKKPAFITILAADNDFIDEMNAEDMAKVHYRGPAYFDFDASSLEEATTQFQKFLTKLKDDHGFDLNQAELYASGGKGYHCIIPKPCLVPKVNPRGYLHLPAIYKEIAMELYVDTLDLRVFTARRGRQFRVANVERPDKPGVHKVPLTVDEVFGMTEERYREIVKAPRHLPPPSPPTLNPGLALLFSQAHDKVERTVKNRKNSKADEALLKKHNGDVPPSIVSLMDGQKLNPGIGFQKIATQLAIAAHALGRTEEQFLGLCVGLCENHVSDGSRYNTPEKRRRELSRMFAYMAENPCYSFSVGGIKSLVAAGESTPDLDSGGVEKTEEEVETEDDLEYSLTCGLRVNTNGIFKKTEEGIVKVCAVGLGNPKQLVDAHTATVMGYEVDVHVDGTRKGSHILDLGMFLSRNRFCQFTLSAGGSSMGASDAQVGGIADILRVRANKTGSQVLTVCREGLDIVRLPDGEMDIIWADPDGVVSKLGMTYRLLGVFTDGAEYKTDLRRSPHLRAEDKYKPGDLLADDTAKEFFERLFRINSPEVMGRLLGWYMAAFLAQPIRELFDQFPLLQVFGQAGSGKTQTNLLLAKLHFYRRKPVLASAMESTPFVMESLVTSSASLPLIFDEVKPREMRKDRLDKLRMLMRGNFNGTDIKKGRVSSETGASKLDIRRGLNGVPLVFIGEALESQTAIEDRCVVVSVNKEGKRGHSVDFKFCSAQSEYLSAFGRNALDMAMNVDLKRLRVEVLKQHEAAAEAWGTAAEDNDRPVFNVAIALTGLEFWRILLERLFGDHFNETLEGLRQATMAIPAVTAQTAMSEIAKVLDLVAHLSYIVDEDNGRYALKFGIDYVVNPGANTVELNVRNCYAKYMQYSRSIGSEALFDSYEAFNAALLMYPGTTDRYCMESPLKVSNSTRIYGLNADRMSADGIGGFKNSSA